LFQDSGDSFELSRASASIRCQAFDSALQSALGFPKFGVFGHWLGNTVTGVAIKEQALLFSLSQAQLIALAMNCN
jgi:hypothetical protein